MIFADQNIHLSHGMTSIRLVFGEHALEMGRSQATEIAQQMLDRLRAEQCCGTCSLWAGRDKGIMGRCGVATPAWVSRDNDMMHRSDGTTCEMYRPR